MEDVDISNAIIGYITANNIESIVVGASTRNAIMRSYIPYPMPQISIPALSLFERSTSFPSCRKFRNPDVPTCLLKSAPEFCAVYVISKGKPMTIRSAKSPSNNALPPRQTMIPASPRQIPDQEDPVR